MARYTGGWIKLHRKLLENELFDETQMIAIWVLLLLWANRKDGFTPVKGQLILTKRGQVVTSPRDLAKKLKLNKNLVERRLTGLEKKSMISRKKSGAGVIITITNYDDHQRAKRAAGNVVNEAKNGRKSGPLNEPLNGPANGPANGPLQHRDYDNEIKGFHENRNEHGPLNGPANGPANGAASGHIVEKLEEGLRIKGGKNPPLKTPNARVGARVRVDRKKLRQESVAILNLVVGAIRYELPDDEAIAYLGGKNWGILSLRYPKFSTLKNAYVRACRESSLTIAEAQFREAIEAALVHPETTH